MTSTGGEWVAVPVPGQPDRWDFVPAEQPPSPDGSAGRWHVVGGSGSEVGQWEWFPAAAAAPPPPPPPLADPAPWEPTPATPAAWEPTPAAWDPTPATPTTSAWEPSEPAAPAPSSPPAWGEGVPGTVVGSSPSWETPPAQSGFPVPPASAWESSPPPAARPRRSLKLPLAIVAGVLAVAVIAVVSVIALTGGDDGKNKEEITALVNFVTTVDDGADVCGSHLTESFVRTVFGDLATCERDDDGDGDEGDATGATVTNFEFDDDDATALVTITGGDTDGATGTWAFQQGEDKVWRVSEWRADYLRSSFGKTFGENYASDGPDDPFDDVDVRTCVKDKMLGQDDPAFLDTAYQLFRNSEASTAKLLGFMSECPSDIAGVSALRALFEKGFRASTQVPPQIAECIVLGMRTGLSDEEIKELSLNRGAPAPADVQSRIEQITISCAGSPQQFDPTPDTFGAPAASFGT